MKPVKRVQPEREAAPSTLCAVRLAMPVPSNIESMLRPVMSETNPAMMTKKQMYGTWNKNTRNPSAAASTGAPVSVS